MTEPCGPDWWWLYMICGNHSRYMMRLMFVVSGSAFMYESRLLSWPA